MKKSLSTILSLALAFSAFSSVAMAADAVKSSADFKDLKDLDAATKAKFDAMISAGVFDGVGADTFGLKDEMNRAQFAKVAALIFGLKVDATLKTSSFSDVKSDDPANGYALPYIEAVKAAGITDGFGPGVFNPAGKVTKEQLATFLVRGLGKDKDAKATPGVNDATVTDWAKGYVALALQLKLLSNGTDGKFGGQSNATRDLLVVSSHASQQAYKDIFKPAKASVAEVKPTGVKTVSVKLDRDVDTTKAKLELTKGGTAVATTTKWADDKKSATLTITDTKLMAGEYTVTLSGLEKDAVDKTSGKFTAEDEKITKVDFMNASETVASAPKVKLQIKASNQYGEQASVAAGSYNVTSTANSATMTKDDAGNLFVVLDTRTGSTANLQQNISQISVNIYNNDSQVSVNKIFKLGTVPYVTKIELGKPKYSNGKDNVASAGDKVVFPLTQLDQYGNIITRESEALSKPNATVTPYFDGLVKASDDTSLFGTTDYIGDDNNDNIDDVIIKLKNDSTVDGSYTLTVFGGTSTTATFNIASTKTAAKVVIDSSAVLAVGDVDKYIGITAYDKAGKALDVDDLIKNVENGNLNINVGGVTMGASNLIGGEVTREMLTRGKDGTGALITVGENKGKIHVAKVTSKGTANVYVYANATNANQPTFSANAMVNVVDARYPASIKTVQEPLTKGLPPFPSLNGTRTWAPATTLRLALYDQYGEEMEKAKLDTPFLDSNNKTVSYDVYFQVTQNQVTKNNSGAVTKWISFRHDNVTQGNNMAGDRTTEYNFNETIPGFPTNSSIKDFTANQGVSITEATYINRYKFAFNTTESEPGNKLQVKFSLRKKDQDKKVIDDAVSSVTKTFEVIDPTKTDLTYTVVKPADLFAAADSNVFSFAPGKNTINYTANFLKNKSAEDYVVIDSWSEVADLDLPLGRSVGIRITDSSGTQIASQGHIVRGVISSDPSKVITGNTPNTDASNASPRFMVGNKPGTAKLTVLYYDAKDGTTKQLFTEVNVKDSSAFSVSKIDATKSNTIKHINPLSNNNVYSVWTIMSDRAQQMTVRDSLGGVYDTMIKLAHAQDLLQMTYTISNVTRTDGGTVATADIPKVVYREIDNPDLKVNASASPAKVPTGIAQISIPSTVQSFTITAIAPSGQMASTSIIVNN